jgi:hypothetical protein
MMVSTNKKNFMFPVDIIPNRSSTSTRQQVARMITSSLSETSPPFVPLSSKVERQTPAGGISKICRIGAEVLCHEILLL